jgi:hypothetical protein
MMLQTQRGNMAKVYQVITGNWLPGSKQMFDTIEKARAHVKKVMDMKDEMVSHSEALSSVRITMIDTKEFPEYKRIFKEFAGIKPEKWRKKPKIDAEASNKPVDQLSKPEVITTAVKPNKRTGGQIKE